LPALREAEGGVKICQRDAGACYPLFEVMNVPADFSTLETKSGNNVSFGHAADLGDGSANFLWRLRHNTARLVKLDWAEFGTVYFAGLWFLNRALRIKETPLWPCR
jgi:hypothetical protein